MNLLRRYTRIDDENVIGYRPSPLFVSFDILGLRLLSFLVMTAVLYMAIGKFFLGVTFSEFFDGLIWFLLAFMGAHLIALILFVIMPVEVSFTIGDEYLFVNIYGQRFEFKWDEIKSIKCVEEREMLEVFVTSYGLDLRIGEVSTKEPFSEIMSQVSEFIDVESR